MSGGLHSLATIIKRLEAATSRLEDMASVGQFPTSSRPDDLGLKDVPSPVSAAPPASGPPPAPPAAPAVQEDPRSVTAYDEQVLNGKLKAFLDLTRGFAGASVLEIVGLAEKQFQDLRGLLKLSANCRRPEQKDMDGLLTPFQATIEAISRLKESNRKDRDWFEHLSVIAEGATFVGWVINAKPGPYINDIKDTVQYYGNRVIKEYKEKDPKHVEWVRAYVSLLEETRKYVMEYHTTGLSWNAKGVSIAEFNASSAPSTAAPPPPPPPPPAPAPPPPAAAAAAPAAGGTAAVFAELNRGAEVTRSLRKVDKSEMTHKNPALRASSTVPATSPTAPGKKPIKPSKPSKPQALAGKKPAKFALEGKNWSIENHEDEKSLVVDQGSLNQAVNIFGCKNSVIQVKGKVNAVTLVNCTKTQVLVDSVVSSVSITKSPSFALQVTGTAPMIQVDSTDSGQIYLSKASLGAEISTAKCSAINVSLPVEGEEDGVFEEQAIPEMLRTVVKDGKLVTSIVEHVG